MSSLTEVYSSTIAQRLNSAHYEEMAAQDFINPQLDYIVFNHEAVLPEKLPVAISRLTLADTVLTTNVIPVSAFQLVAKNSEPAITLETATKPEYILWTSINTIEHTGQDEVLGIFCIQLGLALVRKADKAGRRLRALELQVNRRHYRQRRLDMDKARQEPVRSRENLMSQQIPYKQWTDAEIECVYGEELDASKITGYIYHNGRHPSVIEKRKRRESKLKMARDAGQEPRLSSAGISSLADEQARADATERVYASLDLPSVLTSELRWTDPIFDIRDPDIFQTVMQRVLQGMD